MDTRLPQPRAFHTFSSLSLFFALSLILISPQLAQGQQCYYPNGNLSPNDVPCSSESGSACCPNGWECLSNGLCYLPNEAYLGRYTCTDSTWQSCVNNICISGALSGDQAVLQCSSGNYCCDTNRPDVANLNDPDSACCYTGASQFSLPQGSVIAVIGGGPTVDPTPTVVPDSSPSSTAVTLLPIPPLVTTTTSPAPPITTTPTLTPTPTATSPTQSDSAPVSSTSITSDSSSNPVATSFRVITTVVTNPAGLSTSITDLAPAQTTTALPTPSSSPKRTLIGAIIGGVIALLLAVAILFLCIRKRRQNRDSIFVNTPQDLYTDAPYGYGQKHELPGSSPVLQKPQAVGLGLAGGKDMQEGSDYNGGGAENRRSELDGTPILGTSVSPTVVSEVSGDSPLPQRYEERVPFLRVGQRRGQDSINTLSQASTAVGSQLGQPIFHGIG